MAMCPLFIPEPLKAALLEYIRGEEAAQEEEMAADPEQCAGPPGWVDTLHLSRRNFGRIPDSEKNGCSSPQFLPLSPPFVSGFHVMTPAGLCAHTEKEPLFPSRFVYHSFLLPL